MARRFRLSRPGSAAALEPAAAALHGPVGADLVAALHGPVGADLVAALHGPVGADLVAALHGGKDEDRRAGSVWREGARALHDAARALHATVPPIVINVTGGGGEVNPRRLADRVIDEIGRRAHVSRQRELADDVG